MNTHSTRAEVLTYGEPVQGTSRFDPDFEKGHIVMEDMPRNFDELMTRVAEDELRDRAETSELMSPIDYAKLRGIKPQKVYYYLRTGKLEEQYCNCGRKCVNVVETDALFEDLERKKRKIPLENAEGDSDEDQ
jgi:hypothetical protein